MTASDAGRALNLRIEAKQAQAALLTRATFNRDKQDVAATMEIVTTHVDMTTRRSSPFPPSITARIDELSHRHAELDWAAPTCGAMKP